MKSKTTLLLCIFMLGLTSMMYSQPNPPGKDDLTHQTFNQSYKQTLDKEGRTTTKQCLYTTVGIRDKDLSTETVLFRVTPTTIKIFYKLAPNVWVNEKDKVCYERIDQGYRVFQDGKILYYYKLN